MLPLAIINERMAALRDWGLEGDCIVKDFIFNSHKEAMEFVNKVSEIAEKYNHHPGILIDYTNVRLSLTTHSERGLTSKDFEVAEEIDKL
mgnify:CR=1 FL=1